MRGSAGCKLRHSSQHIRMTMRRILIVIQMTMRRSMRRTKGLYYRPRARRNACRNQVTCFILAWEQCINS